MANLRGRAGLWVAVFVAIAAIGCRDSDPPPAHNRDLGENGVVLLPTASQHYRTEIAKGKADWHAFRDPSDEPPPTTAETKAQQSKELENEIRELIDEYNEVVIDGTVEELLDYYVEDQHERLKPLLGQATELRTTLADLRDELTGKLPDAQDGIAKAFDRFGVNRAIGIDVEAINVVTDTEVTAGSKAEVAFRFRLIDEDWYIEVPAIDQFATTGASTLEQMKGATGAWVSALQSGQSQADATLQQVEAAAQAADMAPAHGETDQPAHAEHGAHPDADAHAGHDGEETEGG